jgi:iron complex transport system substrate-binding protein
MKWWAYLPVLLLAACSDVEPGQEAAKPGAWTDVPNRYAGSFQVQRRGAEKRVIVFGPAGRLDTLGVYAVPFRPAGHDLERVAVVSTTHLPFIKALDRAPSVIAATNVDQVPDTVFRGLADIGTPDGLDKEKLIGLHPGVLFDHPFGKGGLVDEIVPGVPVVLVAEYLEEHPLGRAEWLRFFGAIQGAERKADSLFRAIEHRYQAEAARSAALTERPMVFFGSAWQGQWFASPPESYMAVLIDDAGGRYCFTQAERGKNITLDLEGVLQQAGRCDHYGMILAETGRVTPSVLAGGDPRLLKLEAIRTGGFYGNSATSDLFGQALLEPDQVLRDLRAIFHPRSVRGYRPVYFFPLKSGE